MLWICAYLQASAINLNKKWTFDQNDFFGKSFCIGINFRYIWKISLTSFNYDQNSVLKKYLFLKMFLLSLFSLTKCCLEPETPLKNWALSSES